MSGKALLICVLLAIALLVAVEARDFRRRNGERRRRPIRRVEEEEADEEAWKLFQTILARADEEEEESDSEASPVCATQTLNVRSGACTDKAVVTKMNAGNQAQWTGETQTACGYTWYKVSVNGKQGWAAKNWLNPCGGSSPSAPSAGSPPAFPNIGAPAGYDYANSDSKGPSAGATAMKAWLQKYFPQGSFGGIYNYRPVRGGSNLSLHAEGRAIDWMLNANNGAQKAVGDALFAYLQRNGRNMGVQEAIWNRQIWTASGVRAYNGQNPHTDHVHIGLNRWAAKNFRGN